MNTHINVDVNTCDLNSCELSYFLLMCLYVERVLVNEILFFKGALSSYK